MAERIVELISQLEETKFVRLFRHLSAETYDHTITIGPEPLNLEDAEIQVVGQSGNRYREAQNHFFQIAHLPRAYWTAQNIQPFFVESLTAALNGLRQNPNVFEALCGRHEVLPPTDREWPVEWTGVTSFFLFFTNICGEEFPEEDTYSELAHEVCDRVLDLHRSRHPTFGFGNPSIFMEKCPDAIERFALQLLNSPSSYYLVAREGRVCVAPVTEHGQYVAGEARLARYGLSTVTSALPNSSLIAPGILKEFETLLNSPSVKEDDIQSFLAENSQLLFSLDERYTELRPHVCLYDKDCNRLIPDFMVRLDESSQWHLVELKLPVDRLTVQCGGHTRLSAKAAKGIAELLQYRDVFSSKDLRARIRQEHGINAYEPCLVLVIGRGRHGHRSSWIPRTLDLPRVDIVSYDYLFERARECSKRFVLPELGDK